MILGHLTTTYALREPLKTRFPIFSPLLPLLFGALLPDLIDKPLAIVSDLPGRGIAHSAIVLILVSFFFIKALPANRKTIMAITAGALLHLAEDSASAVNIFWPLLGAWPEIPHLGLWARIYSYYVLLNPPLTVATEFLSYPFCLYFIFRRKSANQPSLDKAVMKEGGG